MRLITGLLLAGTISCTDKTTTPDTAGETGDPGADLPGEIVRSEASRDTTPDVSEDTLDLLTQGNRAFATALYHELTQPGESLFYSPHSASVALAMTLAGANGDTESQMLSALQLELPEEEVHPAFNALALQLASRDRLPDDVTGDGFQLSIVNQTFGQTGYTFEDDFLDTLAVNYGAGMSLLDFADDPDGCRALINDWVARVTEDRIVDLLPEGAITDLSRLVLVNAIYFKASWSVPFDAEDTVDGAFVTLEGEERTVPMMHGGLHTGYSAGDGWALVEIPYVGEELDLTLLVPDAGRFEEIEAGLDQAFLDAALEDATGRDVTLSMPRFTVRSKAALGEPLQALGMTDAFNPSRADFTGMSPTGELYLSAVVHQAFVSVDETGTEAAAATAAIVAGGGIPDIVDLDVDRPFILFVRDRPTGEILFMGRVLDPNG